MAGQRGQVLRPGRDRLVRPEGILPAALARHRRHAQLCGRLLRRGKRRQVDEAGQRHPGQTGGNHG
ncbi:MAG: hypothetical protein A3F70_06950 [Acidobacteria bacterium RIFCSPLOWO2_12_FULL_67_14]|nr:MAG: hypothetical protein A3F70_06950 [Acidobacteria bacterium RIFCSPLOWO2_12_FULL_67_14]